MLLRLTSPRRATIETTQFNWHGKTVELWLEVDIERGEEIPVKQGGASLRQIAVAA